MVSYQFSINTDSLKDSETSLLSEKLDLDYIETLIREKFLFGKVGESTYIIDKNAD